MKEELALELSIEFILQRWHKSKKNLWQRFNENIQSVEPTIVDFKEKGTHTEGKYNLDFGITLYITDTANIAEHNVEMDGLYPL